ncbi:MAG: hypothetical protein M1838_003101 [Thelocarpon superellum]|nr:MAG: hypothetical protein M1838_003101 [Thelocarpon superellum]
MADAMDSPLDQEMARIRQQIATLTHRRSVLTSTILSAQSTQPLLDRYCSSRDYDDGTSRSGSVASPLLSTVLDGATKQRKHSQQCLYRLGAGATMFEVHDPDPQALADGRMLGVRIEVFVQHHFLTPYYLFLRRVSPDSSALCIHRSTLPARVPLSTLAARFLPVPAAVSGEEARKPAPRQRLVRLVHEVRRELVSHHLRTAVVSQLQRGVAASTGHAIRRIVDEDGEARDLRLEWRNGLTGRIRVGKGGQLQRCVVVGEAGRERGVEGRIMTGTRRIEDLEARLVSMDPALGTKGP